MQTTQNTKTTFLFMEKHHLNRQTNPIRMRNYGRIIQDMILVACDEQDPKNKEAMILYIAQCMRQKNLVWNRDQDSGTNRIKDDIHTLSNGRLSTDFPAFEEVMQRKIEDQRRFNPNNRYMRKDRDAQQPAEKVEKVEN